MIKWYPDLYLDSFTKKHVKKIKRCMERKKVTLNMYCIAIASNEKNLFDIYNTNEFLFRYYRQKEMKVVGLASSKENAFLLVADIVNDMYQKTESLDARTFFQWEESVLRRR